MPGRAPMLRCWSGQPPPGSPRAAAGRAYRARPPPARAGIEQVPGYRLGVEQVPAAGASHVGDPERPREHQELDGHRYQRGAPADVAQPRHLDDQRPYALARARNARSLSPRAWRTGRRSCTGSAVQGRPCQLSSYGDGSHRPWDRTHFSGRALPTVIRLRAADQGAEHGRCQMNDAHVLLHTPFERASMLAGFVCVLAHCPAGSFM